MTKLNCQQRDVPETSIRLPGARAAGESTARPARRHSRFSVQLAIVVVALAVLGTISAPGALSAHTPLMNATSSAAVAPSPAVPLRSTSPVVAPTSVAAGTCQFDGSRSAESVSGSANPITPAGGTTGPGPLYNTQVQPYVSFTGPYAYVAGGAALRDQGYGFVNFTWSGTLVAAYMIWAILNNTVPPSNATINGHTINGTWTAFASPSPCWAPTYLYTFAADVTNYVKSGSNNLTGFPSGITNGGSPWANTENNLLDEGATIVVIYEPSVTTYNHQVTIYTGALPVEGAGPTATLNYTVANTSLANTTYIVADGQFPGNSAWWNGAEIDANAFPGSAPKESTQSWGLGNLSDTKSYNVNVVVGSNNSTAIVSAAGTTDCLNWIGQVLSVGVAARPGPYNVTFAEQGLPNGATWYATTNSHSHRGTVVGYASDVQVKLANNTYTYNISAYPGYTVAPTNGTYRVNGGPVFIRVIFHELLYSITFNETGLPSSSEWWVHLTNTTQGVSDNLTEYAPLGAPFLEGNGTYNYSTGEIGLWIAQPPSTTVIVSGTAVSVIVNFIAPPLFNVTFVAVHLPVGIAWGGSVNSNWGSFSNHTANHTYSLLLPNTTAYDDSIYPDAAVGYSNPSYLTFAVSGKAEIVNITYAETFTATLVETGLPVGTSWNGYDDNTSVGSGTSASSTNAFLNFTVVNGSYRFTINPIYAYTATPSAGYFNITAANITIPIVFTRSTVYAITFTETGLAPGAQWSVTLLLPNYTYPVINSTSTTLTVYYSNGSYVYYPGAAGYDPTPVEGVFDVAGAPINLDVSFAQVFTVTFTETGLPSGTDWYVDYAEDYLGSNSPSIVFSEPNASYTYTLYDIGTFVPNVTLSGTLSVAGADIVFPITYSSPTQPTYAVTVNETGLPAGTNWTVDLEGYYVYTTGTTFNFIEDNGSYYFYIYGGAGFTATPSFGYIDVEGGPANQTIVFSQSSDTYLVTFTETGLPDGATWYVNLTDEPSLSATVSSDGGTTVEIALGNGGYEYQAAVDESGWTTASTGSFTVAGVPLGVSIPFTSTSVAQYAVAFTESGLPTGATWFLNITGEPGLTATVSGTSGTTVSINLPNATYTYTATTGVKGWSTPSPQDLTVAGAALNQPVPFSSTSVTDYAVTFTETGLPIGAVWYINVTGETNLFATVTAAGGTEVALSLADGSYTFTAASDLKNWTAPGGHVDVSGSSQTVTVAFTTANSPTTPASNTSPIPWLWISILVIVALLLLLFFIAWRRRKKDDKPPASSNSPPPPSPPPAGSP